MSDALMFFVVFFVLAPVAGHVILLETKWLTQKTG